MCDGRSRVAILEAQLGQKDSSFDVLGRDPSRLLQFGYRLICIPALNVGTRKLMDEFDSQTAEGEGTRVAIIKWLPRPQVERRSVLPVEWFRRMPGGSTTYAVPGAEQSDIDAPVDGS